MTMRILLLDVEVVNGIPTFELAADDRADAYADAFELK